MELLRDPIRLAFAFVGPLILMVAFGYGITFDVENLKYAAFDQDNTPAATGYSKTSRALPTSPNGRRSGLREELERRMRSGELALVVEIPPGFGRDLSSLHSPEVGFWIDAAMPFRGETTQGYVTGSMLHYMQDLAAEHFGPNPVSNVYLGNLNIENRFRYNQGFKSVFSMVPSVIVIMLVLIPAIMATIGVVREKETGPSPIFSRRRSAIRNFSPSSASRSHMLVAGSVMFLIMVIEALVLFQVPFKDRSSSTIGALSRFLHVQFRAKSSRTFTKTQVGRSSPPRSSLSFMNFRAYSCLCPLHRPGKADRPNVSGGRWLQPIGSSAPLPKDWFTLSLVQCARPRDLHGRLLHCLSSIPAQAGDLTCRQPARR